MNSGIPNSWLAFDLIYHSIMDLRLTVDAIAASRFPETTATIVKVVNDTCAVSGDIAPPFQIVLTSDLLSNRSNEIIEVLNLSAIHNLRRYPRPFFIILGTKQVLFSNVLNDAVNRMCELDMSLMKIELLNNKPRK